MEWTVGFLFDRLANRVLLIKKNRPEWQAGKLNGVGGKVEPGETPAQAMRREFREEAGLDIANWDHFMTLTFEAGDVHFYRAFVWPELFNQATAQTDEQLVTAFIDPFQQSRAIPNLRWIIPLAVHSHDRYEPILVSEASASLR